MGWNQSAESASYNSKLRRQFTKADVVVHQEEQGSSQDGYDMEGYPLALTCIGVVRLERFFGVPVLQRLSCMCVECKIARSPESA